MLNLNINKLQSICKKYHVRSLYLVGSSVRKDREPESDIDFMITFGNKGNALDEYFDVLGEIKKVVSYPVDLIEESAIKNNLFKKNILKDKVLLYES